MWSNKKALGYQILGFNGYEGGYPPGGFLSSLLVTWSKADSMNKMRLGQAFPELADMMMKFDMAGPDLFKEWLDTAEVVG